MPTFTIRRNFKIEGVLTDVTSAKMRDATDTYGVKRNDTDAVVVASGTDMTKVSTGVYEYSFTALNGVAYTAWSEFVYAGSTYRTEHDFAAVAAVATGDLTCSFESLVNDVGFSCFGLVPTATDLITEGTLSDSQEAQILRAIRKGLQFVYGAYRWSFLRPKLPITTYPAYSTGTITIDASGNVTLNAGVEPSDGGFPTNAVTAGGTLVVTASSGSTFSGGSWTVGTRTSSTALVLDDYAASGAPAFSSAITYSLVFNRYPIPSGYDSFEGEISFAPSWGQTRVPILRADPVEVRRRLQDRLFPGRPEMYALFTETFDPTVGSTRYFSFYPVPDKQYQLEVIGTWMPAMLDATNKYPLGGTLLSAVITEACLAAAERDIQGMDENHPDAVHCRAVMPLLQAAILRDREYSSPDTLGVDHGPGMVDGMNERMRRAGSIEWKSGGYVGFIS